MKYNLCKILDKKNYEVFTRVKNYSLGFNNISSVENAKNDSLIFIDKGRKDINDLINKSDSSLIIIDYVERNNIDDLLLDENILVLVNKPRQIIISLASSFLSIPELKSNNCTISNDAQIHKSVLIGPNSYIGKSKIGKGVIIYGNAYIYDNVTIGNNVIINAGVVIGADGFGYYKSEDNLIENFPHIGGVIIGDNVVIGANTCIDRGSLGDTVIEDNVKISNLVHIAHNSSIGKNSFVMANTYIGGSTKIGENSWIAPSTSFRDRIVTGRDSKVGLRLSCD